MGGIDPTSCPRVDPTVAWVEIDAEVVALDADDQLHLISETGALLWLLLDGTVSVRELADDVSDAFALSSDRALHDVTAFVSAMGRAGLVEVV